MTMGKTKKLKKYQTGGSFKDLISVAMHGKIKFRKRKEQDKDAQMQVKEYNADSKIQD